MAIHNTFTGFVALVSLPAQQKSPIEVIVDTGFTGELALTEAWIQQLQLVKLGDKEISTANSKKEEVPFYRLDVDWFGTVRKVEVLGVKGKMNLLGMRLLDSRLTQIEMRSNPKTITIQ